MRIGIDIKCDNITIQKLLIDEALDFYNINDSEYKEKCYKCIDELEKNKGYQDKVNEVYETLFIDKTDKISNLWSIKKISDLFGNIKHPFITNVLLLFGYKIHKNNIEKYHLDEEQIKIHKARVKESLLNDIKIRKYNGIRISQMLWGAYFVNLRIIEVGRLQYEFIRFNPLNEEEHKECIKIHIPSGKRLLEKQVKESIIKSKREIKKYFGLENPEYYCSSWLLSPSINKVLDESSNIKKFYNMFEILDEKDGLDDVLNFVFNVKEVTDYTKLEEKTSLQIKIKEMLLKDEKITIGVGILKQI